MPRSLHPRPLLALAALLLSLVACPAHAFWHSLRLQVGAEAGSARFGTLADFTRFLDSSNSYESWSFEFEDEAVRGLRLGLQLREELEIAWTRLYADSRYRVVVDGVEIRDDRSVDPPIQIADVDLRLDLLSLQMRPERLRWRAVAPVFALGFGWVLQSQQGDFQPPRSLPVDFSDTDKAVEASVGLEARWRWLRGGGSLRTIHWRWDSGSEFIPARTTHAFLLDLWATVGF